jgi:BlaI family transcriptional regulator, penicillinase repressor
MSLSDKISPAELEVMHILWEQSSPVSSTEIRRRLQTAKGWEKSTVLTLIRRLQEKGVLSAEKREVLYYSANLGEQEYAAAQTEEMVKRLYQGSAKNMVAALYQGGRLTETDIRELKELFRVEGQDE